MIQRDYILRMVEEFFAVLSRLKALKQEQRWEEAAKALDSEFERLLSLGPEGVAELSETELLARLIRGEPTLVVRQKSLMITSLLKEAGDVAAGRGLAEQSHRYYLKGLNLLLEVLAAGGVSDFPEFASRVEGFTAELAGARLPLPTLARLMQHYEGRGEYGRAEDTLYEMLEAEPRHPGLTDFGIAFYERLAGQTDAALAEGNLPRPEMEAGLSELRKRREAG